MITLITGTPGAGKTLCAVDMLRSLVNEEYTHEDGTKHKRRVLTNIRNLIIEHERIDAADLLKWHEWAKPGDLILFDEVQETWRPRSMNQGVPDCIAKLETHRHMGVDFILVTQHPMLLDQNVRRLVGRHLHIRRVAGMGLAIQYEWDHCSNPSSTKSAVASRPWRYPREVFKLYKSAELHTKQKRRIPVALLVLGAGLLYLAWGIPSTYARFQEKHYGKADTSQAAPQAPAAPASLAPPGAQAAGPIEPANLPTEQARPAVLGCIASATRCECFDAEGYAMAVAYDVCKENTQRIGLMVSATATNVPPSIRMDEADRVAPAGGESEVVLDAGEVSDTQTR